MEDVFQIQDGRLVREYDGEKLWIESWGDDALRVRYTRMPGMPQDREWSLLPQPARTPVIGIDGGEATVVNGGLSCHVDRYGSLCFRNAGGAVLLRERRRDRQDPADRSSLMVPGHELRPIPGGSYQGIVRFESHEDERFYGLGQRQEPFLNLKGCAFELAQRNTEVNIPFAISSRGYGFLWNNPAYGRVSLARNGTQWTAEVTPLIDYWVTAGDTPARILETYTAVTGRVPPLPQFASGFWQCKLRYRTQQELLDVAREYKRRGLPISVIVADFFHWPHQGDWRFDPEAWPDPAAMVKELRGMGIELMVSIWPTVDPRSSNYAEMRRKGFLVQTDRGVRTQMSAFGEQVFADPTHPGARAFLWSRVKANYFDLGIRLFWLDVAEPEYTVYDYDNYRYHLGPNLEVGNIYPVHYAKAFYDGMTQAGVRDVINLARSAWAGSQRYGAAVWSGDIQSSFQTLRKQVVAGLNMGLSGIPWWTTDIGGFFGGDPANEDFRELLVRWFQYGVFCPILRLHGYRLPNGRWEDAQGPSVFDISGPNEIWSYGEKAYGILKEHLFMRERLRPYIMTQMDSAHVSGTPPMRPLFYDFPEDPAAWVVEDQFMFGPEILVAPVLFEGARSRTVYLPAGARWRNANTGVEHRGGSWIECSAPLEQIPVFLRDGADLPITPRVTGSTVAVA